MEQLSSEDFTNHIPRDIRQAEIPPRVTIREARVLEPEQVQDRGVIVIDVNRIGDNRRAEFIRLAVSRAAAHAGAREQTRKRLRVMISPLAVAAVAPR